MDPANLNAVADFISRRLDSFGYQVAAQSYRVGELPARNIIAERRGREDPDRVIVVGAHYDTVVWSPGADDNGSGVAVLLEVRLAESWRGGGMESSSFSEQMP